MIPSIDELLNPDFYRDVLLTVHQQSIVRIFDKGQDANGKEIGEYSDAYVKTRERRGLGNNKKVILQFTGQMRNDYQLINQSGQWGSGFLNQANADKSFWVEQTYEKSIFDLTEGEELLLQQLLDKKIDNTLNK